MDRVGFLINQVAHDGFGQIFITDTSKNRLDMILNRLNSGFRLFSIENSEVSIIAST